MTDQADSVRHDAGVTAPRGDIAFEAMSRYLDGLVAVSFLIGLEHPTRWISESWTRVYGGDRLLFGADPRSAFGHVHPDDLARAREMHQLVAARVQAPTTPAERNLRGEVRLRTTDGSYRWTEVTCDVVRTSDGSRFIVGTAADATALHEARADLAAMTLAEAEANRTTAAFVSKMSHELRTPLHAILGYAQLLEMGAGDPAEYLSRLRRAGDHLVQLLDDLLDFSRMNAARLPVSDDVVDLRPVLDAALDMVSAAARADDVRIARHETARSHVRADATRLRQVLANLLTNAIKYNRPGGSVTITTSVDGDHVVVDIEDTGPGIAPDLIPRLFVPFDRMGAEGSGVSGAGLGLPLTEGLVRAMGGSIEVTSTVGVGTRFRVLLRRAGGHRAASEVRDVVCIDDDPESRRILEAVLSHMPGARVHAAAAGTSGLALIERVQPSLVVLDRHLPDYDPDELLHAVARVAPGCPVVMVSSDQRVLEPAFLRPPIVAAFAKPLDLDVFVDAVIRTWSMRPA